MINFMRCPLCGSTISGTGYEATCSGNGCQLPVRFWKDIFMRDAKIAELKRKVMNKELQLPFITIDGSSHVILLDDLRDALIALRELRSKLDKCSPHTRDYPPRTRLDRSQAKSQEIIVNIFERAVAEHRARILTLENLELEILGLMEGIDKTAGQMIFNPTIEVEQRPLS